jgi:hypothetical protein
MGRAFLTCHAEVWRDPAQHQQGANAALTSSSLPDNTKHHHN